MQLKRTLVAYSVMAALAALSGTAAASGFALIEQSASGLGNAFAGGAAGAEDASTIFFNPAGMSRLSGKQIAVAVHAIKPSAKFTSSAGVPSGGDAGSLAWVPNGYFAMEINPKMKFGLGLNAPFGLQTEYTPTWAGRFQAIKSKIETINLNPSVAYQVSDSLSVGAGVNYQHIHGELTSAVPVANSLSITGSDNAWGYDFGALYNVNSQTRVGMSYRSTISYNLKGSSVSTIAGLNAPVTLAIKMPDSFSASVFHQLDGKWDVMGDISWTGWSVFQQLNVIDTRTGATLGGGAPVTENWKDTWRVSIGSNYHYNDQWIARIGVAYDQSPVSDAFRTARIPDANRTWLSLGGQYKPSKDSALDLGYAHLFVSDASINQPAVGLIGSYKNSVDILSVQFTHSF